MCALTVTNNTAIQYTKTPIYDYFVYHCIISITYSSRRWMLLFLKCICVEFCHMQAVFGWFVKHIKIIWNAYQISKILQDLKSQKVNSFQMACWSQCLQDFFMSLSISVDSSWFDNISKIVCNRYRWGKQSTDLLLPV